MVAIETVSHKFQNLQLSPRDKGGVSGCTVLLTCYWGIIKYCLYAYYNTDIFFNLGGTRADQFLI